MILLAHIGNIPVEEWLPFVAPIVALYLYGRRRDRRRRAAVDLLPDAGELGEDAIREVQAEWKREGQVGVRREHLPLLYPPGPDGATAAEIATRVHAEEAVVERLVEELEDLDYLELDEPQDEQRRAWLTFRGFALVEMTERALLRSRGREGGRASGKAS